MDQDLPGVVRPGCAAGRGDQDISDIYLAGLKRVFEIGTHIECTHRDFYTKKMQIESRDAKRRKVEMALDDTVSQ